MLVLCSDRVELTGLVTELGKLGVDIRLATPAGTEGNELAEMVRMERVTTLPLNVVTIVGWPGSHNLSIRKQESML